MEKEKRTVGRGTWKEKAKKRILINQVGMTE